MSGSNSRKSLRTISEVSNSASIAGSRSQSSFHNETGRDSYRSNQSRDMIRDRLDYFYTNNSPN